MTFLTILGVTEILCSFRVVLEVKTSKEIPESSGLEFLEKFSGNNFALSDAEDKTSGLLNRGGIGNLRLLRTLLAIHQKFREPSFWEVMDSCFVSICKLAASRTLAMITSLSELYFRITRSMLLVKTKESDFYELWQQSMQLKTMEMSEA